MAKSTTQLYRHFAADGTLLYVGISFSAIVRLRQHRRDAHWFDEITRIEIERFPSFAEAEQAERLAIQAEKPVHNLHRRPPRAEVPFEPATPMPKLGADESLSNDDQRAQLEQIRAASLARGQEIEREIRRREAARRRSMNAAMGIPADCSFLFATSQPGSPS